MRALIQNFSTDAAGLINSRAKLTGAIIDMEVGRSATSTTLSLDRRRDRKSYTLDKRREMERRPDRVSRDCAYFEYGGVKRCTALDWSPGGARCVRCLICDRWRHIRTGEMLNARLVSMSSYIS